MSVLLPALMQIRPFVPASLKQTIDRLIQPAPLSKNQRDKISVLGGRVGLSNEEVSQAIDAPGLELSSDGMPKMAFIASMVIVVIAAAITLIGLWHLVSPETSPIPTYAPGTAYGTIRPEDFDALRRDVSKTSRFYKIYPR